MRCGIIKTNDPIAMKTVPPATHDALLYPFPINVTNNTTTSAPISIELGIMLDFVDGNLNCRSIDGIAELAIPFTAYPSMKHIIETNIM